MTDEKDLDIIKCPDSRRETLMRSTLSLGEQLALEQYVSFNYERTLHKRNYQNYNARSSTIYSTYVTLIQADPKIMGNIVDYILDKELSTEGDIEKILFWMSMGIVPYDIWINKVVEDIKEPSWFFSKTSLTGLITVYLAKVLRCSLVGFNKLVKALKEDFYSDDTVMRAVTFAEARYLEVDPKIKEDYMKLIKTDNEDTRRKYYDNEISLFSECLIDMMNHPLMLDELTKMRETGNDLGIFHIYWFDPQAMKAQDEARNNKGAKKHIEEVTGESFDNWNVVGVGPNSAQNIEIPVGGSKPQGNAGMGVFPVDLLGWSVIGEPPANSNKNVEEASGTLVEEPKEVVVSNVPSKGWVVLKVAKDSSNRVMSKKRFPTREEAVQFRELVLKDSPELQDKFEFKIEPIQ